MECKAKKRGKHTGWKSRRSTLQRGWVHGGVCCVGVGEGGKGAAPGPGMDAQKAGSFCIRCGPLRWPPCPQLRWARGCMAARSAVLPPSNA